MSEELNLPDSILAYESKWVEINNYTNHTDYYTVLHIDGEEFLSFEKEMLEKQKKSNGMCSIELEHKQSVTITNPTLIALLQIHNSYYVRRPISYNVDNQ